MENMAKMITRIGSSTCAAMMKLHIFSWIALPLLFGSCCGYARHTNLKCEVLDESFVEVSVCVLKVLGRGRIAANVQLNLRKEAVDGITVNYRVFRKLNGYHTFLFNSTLDYCHYMRHPNPMQVFYYFHRALMPFSNLNHTCPYNHNIILKDFVLADDMFDMVPVPKGSYRFNVKVGVNSTWAFQIIAYLDIDVRQTLRND